MNLTSAIIGDSSVLGHKQHKGLIFRLLPIATIFPLTVTPFSILGLPRDTLPTQLWQWNFPTIPGKYPCCVLDRLPSSVTRLQKPTFLPFSLPGTTLTPDPAVSPTVYSLQRTFSQIPHPVRKDHQSSFIIIFIV